jgi:Tol biopolymer transport system component
MGEIASIASGTFLGPYEILGHLDSGGMGDVYRARDPRLRRQVAIKIVRPSPLEQSSLSRRFELEVKVAGSLDHPNILVVYDTGRYGDLPYLVMELLEGTTLRDYLTKSGPMPRRKALDCAAQVASGLATAHAKGIVHRDLKPSNLFLTRDGRIKILDFGLAKLSAAEGSELSTLSDSQTGSGVLLGTVGYMAPEQVRGEPAGPRADLFSLGVVLYEMLSGKGPFKRGSAAETLAAILTEDPPGPLPSTPPALDYLLRRCLEKRPEDRFQTAHDFGLALRAISESSGELPTSAQPSRGLTRRQMLATAGTAAAVVGGIITGGLFILPRPSKAPVYHRLTYRRGMIRTARFDTDFKTVYYGALWDGDTCRIYRVRPESPESSPVAGLPEATPLAISTLGELALTVGTHFRGIMTSGTLARVPLAGGAPREMLEDVKYADWLSDGSLAVVRRVNGQEQLEFPLGKTIITPSQVGGGFSFPRVSPRGDRVAYLELEAASWLKARVVVADLAGKKTILTGWWPNAFGLAWKGDEIWFTAAEDRPLLRNTIHAVTVTGRRRVVVRIPGNASLHDIAPDGRALIAHTTDRSGIAVQRPNELLPRDLSWLDAPTLVDISRDGSFILFTEGGVGGGPRGIVYIRRTDGATPVAIGHGRAIALSPDGAWALISPDWGGISARYAGGSPYMELVPTGAGSSRRIADVRLSAVHGARFLPDGKRIALHASEADREPRLYLLGLDGGKLGQITPPGKSIDSWAVSPDGTEVAAGKELRIYPLSGGERRPVPGVTSSDRLLAWIEGGLLFSDNPLPTALHKIAKIDPVSGRRENWKEILPRDPTGIMNVHAPGFVVTPDGRSFGYTWHRSESDLYLVQGLS